MASIFTKIIRREIPSYTIAEDADNYAFLDIHPNTKGHVLCVPKQEVNQLFDLEDAAYQSLMAFSKKVAEAIKKTIPCNRVGMAVVGLEVPHAHVHLIPLNRISDMDFAKKEKMSPEEFETLAQEISAHF